MIPALSLFLGCGAPEPPPPEPVQAEPIVSKAFPVLAAEAKPGEPIQGGAVSIELQFQGIADLHQRYFGHQEIITQLSADLGHCFDGRAIVRVSYDSEARVGRIRVYADPKSLRCKPTRSGDAVDLAALETLGKALASYRDTLAGRFDIRIASFRVVLEASSGTHRCRLELSGQFPPDGTTWSPCVSLGGERVCVGEPSAGVRRLTFSQTKNTRYLASCFH